MSPEVELSPLDASLLPVSPEGKPASPAPAARALGG